MAVNPKNQIRTILVRIKNQSEYTSVSGIKFSYICGEHTTKILQVTRMRIWQPREDGYKNKASIHCRVTKDYEDWRHQWAQYKYPWTWKMILMSSCPLFSPMTAPRLWSELFLAIQGGCRFLFLSSMTVTSLRCFSAVSYSCWVSFCDSSPITTFWLF